MEICHTIPPGARLKHAPVLLLDQNPAGAPAKKSPQAACEQIPELKSGLNVCNGEIVHPTVAKAVTRS
ncbi:MAG: hypothetical protein PHV34_03100 [Verrucomicrobiae bacterium]|nr:hypothetical protein [Verrucomicrobiae bacterium]